MTIIRTLLFSLFIMITGCTEISADSTWNGEYHYIASGGETVGGSQIMLNITLIINNHNGVENCTLNADGYQTYDRIICTTKIANNNLMLLFKSYEDGKTTNEIGVERYKVGETLFSLENVNKNNKKQYLAHWGAYTPFGDERNNVKDYFEKQ